MRLWRYAITNRAALNLKVIQVGSPRLPDIIPRTVSYVDTVQVFLLSFPSGSREVSHAQPQIMKHPS